MRTDGAGFGAVGSGTGWVGACSCGCTFWGAASTPAERPTPTVTSAGTGTMDVDGTVGPIGGIQHKLSGSRRDGATWFLAPADNCDEVTGHIPDGLSVV